MEKRIDVSVVIVCMNNLNNLFPCLESIYNNTSKIQYEILVVAYLFSDENLKCLNEKYPDVKIIESHEIRGFSENNNLALKEAKGEYCFVLNDDTEFHMDAIGKLVRTFETLPDKVAILSPKTLNRDGSVQRCGKPRYGCFTQLLTHLRVIKYYDKISKYTNKEGVFRTFNISGACFMIKTEIFEELGWFDERYFFCPEDIALSTLANERGYECFVDSDIEVTHFGGGTWSKILPATMPSAAKGSIIFFAGNNILKKIYIICLTTFFRSLNLVYWKMKMITTDSARSKIFFAANKNTIYEMFSKRSPKEVFIHYYSSLGHGK